MTSPDPNRRQEIEDIVGHAILKQTPEAEYSAYDQLESLIHQRERAAFKAGWNITGEGYNAEWWNHKIGDIDKHLDEKFDELFPSPPTS